MSTPCNTNVPYTNNTLPITKPVRNPIVSLVVRLRRSLQVERGPWLSRACTHPTLCQRLGRAYVFPHRRWSAT